MGVEKKDSNVHLDLLPFHSGISPNLILRKRGESGHRKGNF